MNGFVENGIPIIEMKINGKSWKTVIDTGFNSDLELPQVLFDEVVVRYVSEGISLLAGGQRAIQEFYLVRLPFDNVEVEALATFIESDEILLGTGMLKEYKLFIDFPGGLVSLEKYA